MKAQYLIALLQACCLDEDVVLSIRDAETGETFHGEVVDVKPESGDITIVGRQQ